MHCSQSNNNVASSAGNTLLSRAAGVPLPITPPFAQESPSPPISPAAAGLVAPAPLSLDQVTMPSFLSRFQRRQSPRSGDMSSAEIETSNNMSSSRRHNQSPGSPPTPSALPYPSFLDPPSLSSSSIGHTMSPVGPVSPETTRRVLSFGSMDSPTGLHHHVSF
jgi:hypothetical protein